MKCVACGKLYNALESIPGDDWTVEQTEYLETSGRSGMMSPSRDIRCSDRCRSRNFVQTLTGWVEIAYD